MHSERYSRQIRFKGIGPTGQRNILAARVVVIGSGALGTCSAEMLVRAGIGGLVLVDRDFVELSNLHRQSLFTEEDAREGLPKAVAAERSLSRINSEVTIRSLVKDVTSETITDICSGCSVIVDGTDNFETRYLINDFSVANGIPWVYGACLGSFGTGCAFVPGTTACFRCFCEDPPVGGAVETCETAGVIAPIVHVVAAFQVAQVLKLLAAVPPTEFRLLQVDAWDDSWRTLSLKGMKNPDCECCVKKNLPFLEGSQESRLTRLCGRNAVQVSPGTPIHIDFEQLSTRLSRAGQVDFNDYMMRIRVPDFEIALFPDGRSIIRGTEDFTVARAIYSRYIGM
ncbi:MAG: thiazole biosynthesis adenylyltransferase ThiF [Acidobacteria bacterium]|nr:MAG: thiazole biosynthesis adenylyltransferase ThiF [Acidobacteriota bacterium]